MTDPAVDTDTLRDVTRNEGLWEAEALLITAAADEIDRLRHVRDAWKSSTEENFRKYQHLSAVIESAPHAINCPSGLRGQRQVSCTCWKSSA